MPVCRRCKSELLEEDKGSSKKWCHRCYILVKKSKRKNLLPGLLLFFLGLGLLIFPLFIYNNIVYRILSFIGILSLLFGILLLIYYLKFINGTEESEW